MYNEEIKRDYIESAKTRNIVLERDMHVRFRQCEAKEKELGKDISWFTTKEILDFYSGLCSSSLEFLMTVNSSYSNYAQYCVARNLVPDGQNHFREIGQEDIVCDCINASLAGQKIVTREELLAEIENLANPSDRFIALGIFEGIYGDHYLEIFNAKASDIDDEGYISLYGGRKLKISDELIEAARESAETYELLYYTGDGEFSVTRDLDKSDDHILKRLDSGRCNDREDMSLQNISQRMRIKIVRIRKFLGAECFGSKGLRESGRIDLIKRLMREQSISNAEECIMKNRSEIEYRYGSITSVPRYILKYGKYYEEA